MGKEFLPIKYGQSAKEFITQLEEGEDKRINALLFDSSVIRDEIARKEAEIDALLAASDDSKDNEQGKNRKKHLPLSAPIYTFFRGGSSDDGEGGAPSVQENKNKEAARYKQSQRKTLKNRR